MLVNFSKMHGLGNDFMVVDNCAGDIIFSTEQIRDLSDRHFGVGFDQLLMIESSQTPAVDFRYVIYNADGSEAQQCGNGARCFAKFVSARGLTNNNPIQVETNSGLMSLLINNDQSVRVDMGKPSFNPTDIPLNAPEAALYHIATYEVAALSIGNPHCVMLLNDIDNIDIDSIGSKIQNSDLLPNQANVGFMQIINSSQINLRVFERGVGETLACGSGACAAVIFGVKTGQLDKRVTVHLAGGDVLIEYTLGEHVFLSGAADFVFTGSVEV